MNVKETLFNDFLVKINFHRYLEYYILCHSLLYEDISLVEKAKIVNKIAIYLQKSPEGHNLAMRSQRNRYILLIHCQNSESIKDLNIELFKESYNYVFMKLVEKYSYFDKIIKK